MEEPAERERSFSAPCGCHFQLCARNRRPLNVSSAMTTIRTQRRRRRRRRRRREHLPMHLVPSLPLSFPLFSLFIRSALRPHFLKVRRTEATQSASSAPPFTPADELLTSPRALFHVNYAEGIPLIKSSRPAFSILTQQRGGGINASKNGARFGKRRSVRPSPQSVPLNRRYRTTLKRARFTAPPSFLRQYSRRASLNSARGCVRIRS